uniref:Uncharacterized protein n=1 Tax=Anguilla anguilla TaxID=7936 RepID=A0A0E9VWE0_ANGAN
METDPVCSARHKPTPQKPPQMT